MMDFFRLKNIYWFVVFAFIYMHFLYEFYLGYIIRTQYLIFFLKIYVEKIARNKLTKKKLWTFEWPKINHIFISLYHNHFLWISILFYSNMYILFF
jgi:hypothetical protein